MAFTTWLELHIFLTLLFGWFALRSHKPEDKVYRYCFLLAIIIGIIDFFIGVAIPEYRIPFGW